MFRTGFLIFKEKGGEYKEKGTSYLEVCNQQGLAAVVAVAVLVVPAVVVVLAGLQAASSFPGPLAADFQIMVVLWPTSYKPIFEHEVDEVAPD